MISVAWVVIKKVANKYPPAAPHETKASGVGGWLLVLVFGLIFLGPLVGAARINTAVTSAELRYPNLLTVAAWDVYKSATWWAFALVSSLSIYAGIGLLKGRNSLVVKRAKIILWVVGPAASLIMGIAIPRVVLGGVKLTNGVVTGLVESLIVAIVWTSYLSRSKRVRATYTQDIYNHRDRTPIPQRQIKLPIIVGFLISIIAILAIIAIPAYRDYSHKPQLARTSNSTDWRLISYIGLPGAAPGFSRAAGAPKTLGEIWNIASHSPKYLQLNNAGKNRIRNAFFHDFVLPRVSPQNLSAVRAQFDHDTASHKQGE